MLFIYIVRALRVRKEKDIENLFSYLSVYVVFFLNKDILTKKCNIESFTFVHSSEIKNNLARS